MCSLARAVSVLLPDRGYMVSNQLSRTFAAATPQMRRHPQPTLTPATLRHELKGEVIPLQARRRVIIRATPAKCWRAGATQPNTLEQDLMSPAFSGKAAAAYIAAPRDQVRLEAKRTPSSKDDFRAKLLLNAGWCGRCCRNHAC